MPEQASLFRSGVPLDSALRSHPLWDLAWLGQELPMFVLFQIASWSCNMHKAASFLIGRHIKKACAHDCHHKKLRCFESHSQKHGTLKHSASNQPHACLGSEGSLPMMDATRNMRSLAYIATKDIAFEIETQKMPGDLVPKSTYLAILYKQPRYSGTHGYHHLGR